MNRAENVLGLGMITNEELGVWLEVLTHDTTPDEDGKFRPAMTDPAKIMDRLTLINELLILQKSKLLLTRKRGLKDMLDARLSKECGFSVKNMNVKI